MVVLEDEIDVFADNSTALAAGRGPLIRLELKVPNSAPYVAPIRH